MKWAIAALALIICSALMQQPALADVEAHDDEINCDFTIIGWTKQSLIERKQ